MHQLMYMYMYYIHCQIYIIVYHYHYHCDYIYRKQYVQEFTGTLSSTTAVIPQMLRYVCMYQTYTYYIFCMSIVIQGTLL